MGRWYKPTSEEARTILEELGVTPTEEAVKALLRDLTYAWERGYDDGREDALEDFAEPRRQYERPRDRNYRREEGGSA
jgi:hypothetical protein